MQTFETFVLSAMFNFEAQDTCLFVDIPSCILYN